MKIVEFDSVSGPGKKTVGFICEAQEPKATIQVCHGMSEYFERYLEFAEYFNKLGYTVCGIDMQGHGRTQAKNSDPLGYMGDEKDTYKTLAEDNLIFRELVEKNTGQAPTILYGHSMGSFVVRMMYSIKRYSDNYDAFIISSTKGPEPLAGIGIVLASILCFFGRSKKSGGLLSLIAFGSYNKRVKNKKNMYDWISTDETEVTKYANDPLCNYLFTNKGYYDLFKLVKFIQSKEAEEGLCGKPCQFLYADEDPVGSYGKGVKKVIEIFKAHKVPLEEKDFGPYRHELMHEPIRFEYFKTVADFVEKNIS